MINSLLEQNVFHFGVFKRSFCSAGSIQGWNQYKDLVSANSSCVQKLKLGMVSQQYRDKRDTVVQIAKFSHTHPCNL